MVKMSRMKCYILILHKAKIKLCLVSILLCIQFALQPFCSSLLLPVPKCCQLYFVTFSIIFLGMVTNSFDQFKTPQPTKNSFPCRYSLQMKNSTQDGDFLNVEIDGKFTLDATSPDNCFIVYKPVQQVNSDSLLLHDTLLISNTVAHSSNVLNLATSANMITDETTSQHEADMCIQSLVDINQMSPHHYNVLKDISNTGAILSELEIADENDDASVRFISKNSISNSHSITASTIQTNSYSTASTPPATQLTSTYMSKSVSGKLTAEEVTLCSGETSNGKVSKDNFIVNFPEISDKNCKKMLLATKYGNNSALNHDSLSNHMPDHVIYEKMPAQHSFCTFTDSTIPVEEINFLEHDHGKNTVSKWELCSRIRIV